MSAFWLISGHFQYHEIWVFFKPSAFTGLLRLPWQGRRMLPQACQLGAEAQSHTWPPLSQKGGRISLLQLGRASVSGPHWRLADLSLAGRVRGPQDCSSLGLITAGQQWKSWDHWVISDITPASGSLHYCGMAGSQAPMWNLLTITGGQGIVIAWWGWTSTLPTWHGLSWVVCFSIGFW
jgi:hypothetical protein